MDGDHLGDLPLAVSPGAARSADILGLAQTGDETALEFAARIGVDRVVDGFVGDMHGGVVGPFAPQCFTDLARRPTPTQQRRDEQPCRAAFGQLARRSAVFATLPGRQLRRPRSIAVRASVARDLAAQRTWGSSKKPTNLSQTLVLLAHARQRRALIGAQVFESSGHLRNLPQVEVLHFRLESAEAACELSYRRLKPVTHAREDREITLQYR